MTFLYITADQIGKANHGAGSVTANESEALLSLGEGTYWGRNQFGGEGGEPWRWDNEAVDKVKDYRQDFGKIQIVHFYAGTFSRTVAELKRQGCKITYTAAAHSIDESRKEHEKLGLPFPYPHLTEPDLWKRYVQGYLDADVLICPSKHSADVMLSYGATNRIEVIPHGVEMPKCKECSGAITSVDDEGYEVDRCTRCCMLPGIEPIAPLPQQFTVGYLGAIGADKGLIYLLEAWKRLNYRDAVLKIGGGNSHSPWMKHLVEAHGGGNIQLLGWVDDPWQFYSLLSLYVQPSVSEGFGCEVLEAMSAGRPVICSEGAGASDCVPEHWRFKARDVDDLVECIRYMRTCSESKQQYFGSACNGLLPMDSEWIRGEALKYEWDKIRARYVEVWKSIL